MKKTLAITALVFAATAGVASAASNPEFALYGVDAADLTTAQVNAVEGAIHGGDSRSEVQAKIFSILNNG